MYLEDVINISTEDNSTAPRGMQALSSQTTMPTLLTLIKSNNI